MEQVFLKITGRVQGVFYRAHAQEKAEALGLAGYVKNLPDGGVEALIQGEEEQLKIFIDWAKKGPPSAEIDNIKIIWQPPTEIFNHFEIKY